MNNNSLNDRLNEIIKEDHESYEKQLSEEANIKPESVSVKDPSDNTDSNQIIEPSFIAPPNNIFEKLRVNPQITQENVEQPKENSNDVPNYDNTYDLRFAINNFRQAIQNTEKFGFKITANEFDSDTKYKIVIEIDK